MKNKLIVSAFVLSFVASTLEGCDLSTVLLFNAVSVLLLMIGGMNVKNKSPRMLAHPKATRKKTIQQYYNTTRREMQ